MIVCNFLNKDPLETNLVWIDSPVSPLSIGTGFSLHTILLRKLGRIKVNVPVLGCVLGCIGVCVCIGVSASMFEYFFYVLPPYLESVVSQSASE